MPALRSQIFDHQTARIYRQLERLTFVAGWICGLALFAGQARAGDVHPYGLSQHSPTQACLLMPENENGAVPKLLSQTGAFKNVRDLEPAASLIPYDLNVAFWSDGASKSRWVAVPSNGQKIGFAPAGEWTFPNGTVFVKHFELATDETQPASRRRLETRLLVRNSTGSVYGVTYKWRADGSDADLLATNLTEAILIKTATGVRTQTWYYPSRQDCRVCHSDVAGGVLGVKTRQLNRDFAYPGGVTDNELRAWNHIGLFAPAIDEAGVAALPRLARADDLSRSLDDRARSYLDANCAHCHRPGGTVGRFDARYDTPAAQRQIINGSVVFIEGLDQPRVVAPNDIWRSIAYLRVSTLEGMKMPPLARNEIDQNGVALLRQWIESLPGPQVLAPPEFTPLGGNFANPITITVSHPEPGVTIRYTLDGTTPTPTDPIYTQPLKLTDPTTLRARAYKAGFTRSIPAQQTYIIGE